MRGTARWYGKPAIADSAKGYLNSSGPIVINGKVIQGLGGCDEYNEAGCFISAYDAATGKQLWKFYTVAREGKPGGDTWGKLPNMFRAGGETWITGSYDPDLESDLLGRRAAEAVDAGQPRHDGVRQGALHELDAGARPDTGKLAWYAQHVPGEALDLDEVFERVLVDIGDQKLVFSVGKAGILWKHRSRRPANSSARRRWSSRTSTTASTRRPARRATATTSSSRRSISGLPPVRAPRAGMNWPAMSYHRADAAC